MRVLVLGATGMAGHMIAQYLKEKGVEVTTFTRQKFHIEPNINGDARDFEMVRELIIGGKFDYVINCIGVLNKKNVDLNIGEGILLNSFFPHYLCEVVEDLNTKIVHISTDCVFSGSKGMYTEKKDAKDGLTNYAKSKSLGEIVDKKNITIRTSIIGPDLKPNGIGLFNWFMKQSDVVQGYSNAIWSGVTTLELAKAIEHVLRNNMSGLVNLTNGVPISKLNLLELFNKHFKYSQIKVSPCEYYKSDKSLLSIRDDFKYSVPDYDEMISDIYVWIQNHKRSYPHYFEE